MCSLLTTLDIGTMWHCALVSCIPSQPMGLFVFSCFFFFFFFGGGGGGWLFFFFFFLGGGGGGGGGWCVFFCVRAFLVLSVIMSFTFVCFITKSFLTLFTYTCFINKALCRATCVQSYQRQPRPAVDMRGPGIGCWFSNRYIPLYYTTGLYTTLQPTLLTSWLQLLPYKVQITTAKVCTVTAAIAFAYVWGSSCQIFHFRRWLGQQRTVLTKDESPHTGNTFTPWAVSLNHPNTEH